MKTETYILPDFWLCALINGDYTGMDEEDISKIDAFTADMIARHGQCWALTDGESQGFMKHHDARRYGVLACDAVEVIFDVTPR